MAPLQPDLHRRVDFKGCEGIKVSNLGDHLFPDWDHSAQCRARCCRRRLDGDNQRVATE
jgi:hypothetical protein